MQKQKWNNHVNICCGFAWLNSKFLFAEMPKTSVNRLVTPKRTWVCSVKDRLFDYLHTFYETDVKIMNGPCFPKFMKDDFKNSSTGLREKYVLSYVQLKLVIETQNHKNALEFVRKFVRKLFQQTLKVDFVSSGAQRHETSGNFGESIFTCSRWESQTFKWRQTLSAKNPQTLNVLAWMTK